jgi:regulator of nucleoside diphosphate kinase
MTRRQIIITTEDHKQLQSLLASNIVRWVNGSDRLDELQAELRRARIVPQDDVPSDVVTMNSTVSLRDLGTDEVETYTLVYPDRADIANQKLSVLAPIGTGILGYRVGDEFRWRVPEGWRRLKVEEVIYQPERDRALRVGGRA